MDKKKNPFTMKTVKLWKRLPRKVVQSPDLISGPALSMRLV